ncbi:uncharacterized protein C6orf132 homolog [Pelodytes ibericus]
MKKNNSMQGTLNKLFGKKNSNNNSLYADNPPWILTQGSKKGSDKYQDDMVSPFSFLDDSGTATLKARPGPRVRPVLQFSNSNTETHGLAVPTPSIPAKFSETAYLGNGPQINGNYRMYSSVGDLRQNNHYEDHLDEDIPAPPSMPPPPPPTMPPPPPPKESPPSSTISSPASPSPPDFIPPTPNSSAPVAPNFVPPVPPNIMTLGDQQQLQMHNASKWKSETVLNTLPADGSVGLPNRFSLNPILLHKHGQLNYDVEPHSTLPRSFKIPPPAPARTSSILQQEQMIQLNDPNYSKEPPGSPVPSSFKPSVQAKLFTTSPEQKSLNDTINKRKSMIIMEDPHTVIQTIDQIIEKAENEDYSKAKEQRQTSKISKMKSDLASIVSNKSKANEGTKRPQSSIEFNKINKEVVNDSEFLSEAPPTPPPMVPPPPPSMAPPNPPSIPSPPLATASTLPPVSLPVRFPNASLVDKSSVTPPAPPYIAPIPTVSEASPSLAKRNGTVPPAPPLMVPPPPPPKAPPAPPLLPTSASPSSRPPHQPLHKVLQTTAEGLKPVPKMGKCIEIKPAQPPVNMNDDDQKNRVGKIKEELESLLSSPKKDQKVGTLTNSRQGLEGNKKSGSVNIPPFKGGENNLVNSLMLKVPLLPTKPNKEDFDTDSSDWAPKNNKMDIQIPEPDYVPINKTQNSDAETNPPADIKSYGTTPPLQIPPSPPKFQTTNASTIVMNPVPSYKAHNHERKSSTGSWNFDTVLSKQDAEPNVEKDMVCKSEEILSPKPTFTQESPVSRHEGVLEHPATGEKIEAVSPMALLLAAKKRAEKGARATERSSLPKVLVTNGSVTTSLSHSDGRNTFVVVPKQENRGPLSQESGLASFNNTGLGSVALNNDSGKSLSKINWKDEGYQTPNQDLSSDADLFSSQRTQYEINKPVINMSANPVILTSSANHWRPKSEQKPQGQMQNTFETSVPKNMSHQSDLTNFNISSCPSPIPILKTNEDMEFGIIPPPAEFMNSPEPNMNALGMQQQERSFSYDHGANSKYDFRMTANERNYTINNTLVSQTADTRDYNRYNSDDYSSGVTRDSHKGSLIKKRLYMPEPEVSRNYSKNASSLRSAPLPMSYSHMHTQSSSSMAADPRYSTAPSRYSLPGRRVSSENLNRMAPMNDLKYKPQNPEYPVSKMANRPQNYPGMTFTVRPGTRQPISNTYQGGYL